MRTDTTRICCLLFVSFLLSNQVVTAQQNTVKIGTQEWMTRNLDVTEFKNGDPIRQAKTSIDWLAGAISQEPMWCYYEYSIENGNKYGKLYSFYAMIDPRGLAPAGYHIPSDGEWTTLENSLGGIKVAGVKLAVTDSRGPANNQSGFSGLPSGILFKEGDFQGIGFLTIWWSSTSESPKHTWSRMLSYAGDIERAPVDGLFGLVVRCIKDKPGAVNNTKPVNIVKPVAQEPKPEKTVIKIQEPVKETGPVRKKGLYSFQGPNGKTGFKNELYEVVLEPLYETNYYIWSSGYAALGKDKKWGFIDITGKLVIPFVYEEANGFHGEYASVKKNGKWGFINTNDDVIVPFSYDDARYFSGSGFAAVSKYGYWGFIDITGAVKIDFQYDYAFDFSDGAAAVQKDKVWGYIDKTGNYLFAERFESAGFFTEGRAQVKKDGVEYYIDKKGKRVTD